MVGKDERRRSRTVLGLNSQGFHRMVYHQWGKASAPAGTVVCVHGLTRNGRDFDALAGVLEEDWRVVAPDVVGRGESDWLPDPSGYAIPQYLSDMNALLARLDVEQVAWVGTSMGGLIGMTLAALPQSPIRRLVINDVGPLVPTAPLKRISDYVGHNPQFADEAEAEAYLREIHAPFGALSDAQWRHLTATSIRQRAEGGWVLRYDPGIAVAFAGLADEPIDIWSVWDQVRCPVLVLRGAESDLLPREVAEEMTSRGPRARVVEFSGCGHAPALMDRDQIDLIAEFLAER